MTTITEHVQSYETGHSIGHDVASRPSLFVWLITAAISFFDNRELRHELERLSDHQLRDIGLSPDDVRDQDDDPWQLLNSRQSW